MSHATQILATIHYPSLNPAGPPSILTTLIYLIFAAICSRRLNRRHWRTCVFIAPNVCLPLTIIAFLMAADRRPNAEDYVAATICAAFAFGLALANFRAGASAFRVTGTTYTIIFGIVIALLVALPFTVPIPPLYSVAAFLACWVPILFYLNRWAARQPQAHTGFCRVCRYDLRASYEFGRCPECGTQIPGKTGTSISPDADSAV